MFAAGRIEVDLFAIEDKAADPVGDAGQDLVEQAIGRATELQRPALEVDRVAAGEHHHPVAVPFWLAQVITVVDVVIAGMGRVHGLLGHQAARLQMARQISQEEGRPILVRLVGRRHRSRLRDRGRDHGP